MKVIQLAIEPELEMDFELLEKKIKALKRKAKKK